MPCMYEDIYRISTGENLKTEDWKIPAEEYERIMTIYFPVSIEQLREYRGYDEGSNSYEYEMIYASPYPPFGEVVDYTKMRMERLHLSWMEYGRIIILISLFGIRLWSSHLKTELSGIFPIL